MCDVNSVEAVISRACFELWNHKIAGKFTAYCLCEDESRGSHVTNLGGKYCVSDNKLQWQR